MRSIIGQVAFVSLLIGASYAQQIFPTVVEGQVGEIVTFGCLSTEPNEQQNIAVEIYAAESNAFVGAEELPRVNRANDVLNLSLSTFTFGPLRSEDNGVIFRCSSLGSITANATVNVIFAPVITSAILDPIVEEGMDFTVPLTISANPLPSSYVWTLNDGPITTENGITVSLNSIMFSPVSRQHAGTYKINVTNSVGSDTFNFTLDVRYQSEFLSDFVEPGNFNCRMLNLLIQCAANPLETVTFLCDVAGNPMPTVSVTYTSNVQPTITGTNIMINSAMSGNAGNYTCTAQNQGFADVQRIFQLFVGGPPQAASQVNVQIRSNEIVFNWTYDSVNEVPATAFVITITREGNAVLTVTIPVSQMYYTVSLSDLTPNQAHTVSLMVQNLQGNSQTVTNLFMTPEGNGCIGSFASIVMLALMCGITFCCTE